MPQKVQHDRQPRWHKLGRSHEFVAVCTMNTFSSVGIILKELGGGGSDTEKFELFYRD